MEGPCAQHQSLPTMCRLHRYKSLRGSSVWDGSGTAVLTACAPLAKHSLWFSQRLLVLLLVKAANMPKSGSSLAKA